jgi:excisionase family DNA binding protein
MSTPVAVSADRAAETLGVSRDTVRRLIRRGHLPRVPHLSVIRVPVAAIEAFAMSGVAA